MMDRKALRGAYARLRGIKAAANANDGYMLLGEVGRDYDKIVTIVQDLIGEALSDFKLPAGSYEHWDRGPMLVKEHLTNKLEQFIQYLEFSFNVAENIREIGSIFNSIRDEEFKSRCADLLSAAGNFYRVINQATLVLESRVRDLVQDDKGLAGASLVGKYIKADPTLSPIELSAEKGEQEGYANLFKGVVAAFRNPSHHKFLENITREQALQICAFIDNLLGVLRTSKVDMSRA